MAKQTALGDSFFVGQYDLSGDVGAINSAASPRAIIDVSSLAVSGYERLLGRADGHIEFAAFYNPAAGQEHAALSPIGTAAGTANTIVSWFHQSTVGNDVASLYAKQVDYGWTIGADQSIALAVQTQAGSGVPLEWGQMLTTAKQTFASGTAQGTAIDGGAATSYGAAAYLHVFSIASGTATVSVQDSADNLTFADVTGLIFTAVTGATFERVATAATATLKRYVRLQVLPTYTNLICAVSVVRYPTSQT